MAVNWEPIFLYYEVRPSDGWDGNCESGTFAEYILFHKQGDDDERYSTVFILDDRGSTGPMDQGEYWIVQQHYLAGKDSAGGWFGDLRR
jgi:hypothetical protein